MISLYKNLTYEEDDRKENSNLYKTNRICEHKTIIGKTKVQNFLEKFNLPLSLLNEQISFSVLWNLPRKQYNETIMWVCLSGCTHNGIAPFNHFVVSDNIVNEKDQYIAKQIIKYLNNLE